MTTVQRTLRRASHPTLATAVVIVVILVATAVDLLVHGVGLTPDSVSYMSMAQGVRQHAAAHWSGGPTGLWPYGFPFVIAAVGAQTTAMIQWSPLLMLVLLLATTAYLVAIARFLGARRHSAAYLIATAALLASPAMFDAARWLESELLFTLVTLAFTYHVVIRSLLLVECVRPLDSVVGTVAAFILPNVRYIGLAAPLGIAFGVVVLLVLKDPDVRRLWRRAAAPIVGGLTGFGAALLINVLTAKTLMGERVPPIHLLNWTVLSSVATFWQTMVGPDRLPLFSYEVAAGLLIALAVVGLAAPTIRVASRHGDIAYRRLTVWTLTGIGTYLAVLYWTAFTTLLDPISPRFVLPILPITVMWLVDSYQVASRTGLRPRLFGSDRAAGCLVVALWLGSFGWSTAAGYLQPARPGDLVAMRFGEQDRECLRLMRDSSGLARLSNNAALLWLQSDEHMTARQASYEVALPPKFFFIDMRAHAVGDVPAELSEETTGSQVCVGENLAVESRTHR